MKEVSCRIVATMLQQGERRGQPTAELLAGLPYPRTHLLDPDERVYWADFVRLLANLGRTWQPEDFARIGRQFIDNPFFRPFRTLARLLANASDVYEWITRDTGPGSQLFTCIESAVEPVQPGRLRFAVQIWDSYDASPQFFELLQGMLEAAPTLIGLQYARVQMSTQSAGMASYLIDYPRQGGALRWLRRVLSWPVTVVAAAQELRAAHSVLRRRYHELESVRGQLADQARLLRTANRISQVVHGEMDLKRTIETVVTALVEVANYAQARLCINTELEGRPIQHEAQRGAPTPGVEPLSLPIVVRGQEVAQLTLWLQAPYTVSDAVAEVADTLVPTISMALDDALTLNALTSYRARLEEKVSERTNELAQARDSLAKSVRNLQQAQAARDRIFANINHEIRTPLALILLAAHNLKLTVSEPSADISSIETSVRRLLDLVDGLLLLAAGQEGKLLVRPAAIDLGMFLRHVVSLWHPAASESALQLLYEGPSRCGATLDESACDRVMANLLSNAVKFTPAGGTIVVRLVEEPQWLRVEVHDTGVGIDEEFRTRIFGRFEQGRPAVRGGMRGSGIGLSLVKELVEAHEGRVMVDSTPGNGSVFTLLLPKSLPAAAEAMQKAYVNDTSYPVPSQQRTNPAPPPPSPSEATILLAEDDAGLADALMSLLSKHYRVIAAQDGVTALRLAEEHLPDLLISDVQMPGMDGIELSRRFRDLPGNRLAPTLLLTAHSGLASRLAGFEAGAVDYVLKPFEPAELLARVRSQLALRQLALRLIETEKLASLGVLSAGLAHELRNPANAVVNAVEPLCELLPEEVLIPGTGTAELLEVIRHGALQLRALSQQLLGFVRPGQLLTHEEAVETLIARSLAMTSNTLRGIDVRKSLQYTGAVACAGPLMVQVLTNLLENAAHAAGRKGWISVIARQEKARLFIEVSDSGPGIPNHLRERIFEPFFTTKPPGSGSGLGLSTARTILERHQGSISVIDGAVGTTFRIELPLPAVVEPEGEKPKVRRLDG